MARRHKTRKNGSVRLKDLATVKTNFPGADFWLIRKGSEKTVGSVTKTYSPEYIGIRVDRTDVLLPNYLYYALMHIHGTGYWKPLAHGTLRLQNIRTEDVKNLRMGMG